MLEMCQPGAENIDEEYFPKGGKITVVKDKASGREVIQQIEIPPGAHLIVTNNERDFCLGEA